MGFPTIVSIQIKSGCFHCVSLPKRGLRTPVGYRHHLALPNGVYTLNMSESILGAFQANSNEPMFHLIGKYDNQTSGVEIPKADIASCWVLCPLLRFNTTFHDSSETELKIQILAKYYLIFSSNTINAGTEFYFQYSCETQPEMTYIMSHTHRTLAFLTIPHIVHQYMDLLEIQVPPGLITLRHLRVHSQFIYMDFNAFKEHRLMKPMLFLFMIIEILYIPYMRAHPEYIRSGQPHLLAQLQSNVSYLLSVQVRRYRRP